MAERALPERPGWCPDPYNSAMQRWFDEARWTMQAVPGWEMDPDQVVQRNWSMVSPEQLRRQEWEDEFPPRDFRHEANVRIPMGQGKELGDATPDESGDPMAESRTQCHPRALGRHSRNRSQRESTDRLAWVLGAVAVSAAFVAVSVKT